MSPFTPFVLDWHIKPETKGETVLFLMSPFAPCVLDWHIKPETKGETVLFLMSRSPQVLWGK
jgi:hypothetical protein